MVPIVISVASMQREKASVFLLLLDDWMGVF